MESLFSLILGLGIFLYGMHLLERGLGTLGSDRIKQWLSRTTRHPTGSVLSGTIITAILQSSSMVSLVVLAFASAGLIPLFNAIGVILGANLGTTFTGWIVTTIGFKLDLGSLGIPLVGLSSLALVFSASTKIKAMAEVAMGLGFLLFGLEYMKDAVASFPEHIDPEFLSQLNLPLFLLFGMVMTAIIQSSSAMTLIALTALNSGVIELQSAAAMIIGADIGTTSTTAIGSIKSSAVAKQLAMAHVIYNLCVDALAFIVLLPVLPAALSHLGISDPLYGLVLFHSAFNFFGLFIFVPILKPYANWLSGFFNEPRTVSFLSASSREVPEAGVVALLNELDALVAKVLALNLRNLKLEPAGCGFNPEEVRLLDQSFASDQTFEERYDEIKTVEGQIHDYISSLDLSSTRNDLTPVIYQITACARQIIYSAKSLKDVRADLVAFRHDFRHFFEHVEGSGRAEVVYSDLLVLLYRRSCELLSQSQETSVARKRIIQMLHHNEVLHRKLHDQIFQVAKKSVFKGDELATLLNTNRELWHSNLNLVEGIGHLISARDELVKVLSHRSLIR